MVCPDSEVSTSPGKYALPSGIFLTAGTKILRFIGKSISATALSVPKTEAAPHISNFISSMFAGGFRQIPPVSKQTPLPIKIIGASLLLLPL